MAENTCRAPVALANFVRQIRGVLLDITPHLLRTLLEYLMASGAHSEADIAKMDEHQLAVVLGLEDARLLLLYFKMRRPAIVRSVTTTATQLRPRTGNKGLRPETYLRLTANTMAENTRRAPVALANFVRQIRGVLLDITPHLLRTLLEYLMASGAHSEADIAKMDEHQLAVVLGLDDARLLLLYFKMRQLMKTEPPTADNRLLALIMMQKIEAEKNRRMLMMMQRTQDQTLDVVVQQMTEMTAVNKSALDTMSQHMVGQSEMHQEALRMMNEQMKTMTFL
ncbi:uncharacterized protein LOC144149004 [Haemaphysalis longicornis]